MLVTANTTPTDLGELSEDRVVVCGVTIIFSDAQIAHALAVVQKKASRQVRVRSPQELVQYFINNFLTLGDDVPFGIEAYDLAG